MNQNLKQLYLFIFVSTPVRSQAPV